MKVDDVFEFEGQKVEVIAVVKNDENYILCVLKNMATGNIKTVIYAGASLERETNSSIAPRLIKFESTGNEYSCYSFPAVFENFFLGKFDGKIADAIKKYQEK